MPKNIIKGTLSISIICILANSIAACSTAKPQTKTINKSTAQQLPQKLQSKLDNSMVHVQGGSFIMGSDSDKARNREKPAHSITLDSFYLSKFELTQDIFQQVMGWNNSYYQCDNCPVNNISWLNMQVFISRLNQMTGKTYRLPTEAEWEYAAKGGQNSKGYMYSGSNDINEVAWYASNANNKTHSVGLKKPNELGLFDMTGNLWEFCQDDMVRNAYKFNRTANPLVEDTKRHAKAKAMKVLRGGGYEFTADESLVFIRDGATNNVRMADIGFRLAMSVQ